MTQKLMNQFEALGTLWCRVSHNSAMWPAHGQYECAKCHRHYPVPWEQAAAAPAVQARPVMHSVTVAVN